MPRVTMQNLYSHTLQSESDDEMPENILNLIKGYVVRFFQMPITLEIDSIYGQLLFFLNTKHNLTLSLTRLRMSSAHRALSTGEQYDAGYSQQRQTGSQLRYIMLILITPCSL